MEEVGFLTLSSDRKHYESIICLLSAVLGGVVYASDTVLKIVRSTMGSNYAWQFGGVVYHRLILTFVGEGLLALW